MTAAAKTLEVAERLLDEALTALRMLTPEGWDEAYYEAMFEQPQRWNTRDVAMMKDARLLSMRGGPRFGPEVRS